MVSNLNISQIYRNASASMTEIALESCAWSKSVFTSVSISHGRAEKKFIIKNNPSWNNPKKISKYSNKCSLLSIGSVQTQIDL